MRKFPRVPLLAGIAAGILFTASVISVVGPTAGDTPGEMAAKLADGRTWTLLAFFGAGLWAMLGLWFLSAFHTWLRTTVPGDGDELSTAVLMAGVLAIGLALVGLSLFYGATYSLAGQGGSQALRGLVDAASAVMMLMKFPAALLVATVSVAALKSSLFPRWFASLGFFSVFALIASAVGLFTTDHFTEFGGPLDFYGTFPAGLWGVLLMGFLYRSQPSAALGR